MNMSMQDQPTLHSQTTRLRVVLLVIIALVAILGAFFLGDFLSYETLRDNRAALIELRDANPALSIALFMAVYIGIVAFSLPGATAISLTGGFLFGAVSGTAINVVAATIGATFLFLAARWGMGERLAAKLDASDGRIGRFKTGIDRHQWSMLFLIRLIPLVPFFVANLLPALLGVPLRRFLVSTFLGIIPGALVITSVGAGLGDVFARGESPDLGVVFEPQILLPLMGLAALAALPIVFRLIMRRRQ